MLRSHTVDVAVSHRNIGVVYAREQKWGRVVEYFEKGYRIKKKVLGGEM